MEAFGFLLKTGRPGFGRRTRGAPYFALEFAPKLGVQDNKW